VVLADWTDPPAICRPQIVILSTEVEFSAEQPGRYRLRAATTDLAGCSTVVWKEFKVGR